MIPFLFFVDNFFSKKNISTLLYFFYISSTLQQWFSLKFSVSPSSPTTAPSRPPPSRASTSPSTSRICLLPSPSPSAHWCGPCRQFTPKFAELYNKIKAEKNIEVVWSSKDHDQAGFDEYFQIMPWLAIPFSEATLRSNLESIYDVHGIPTVIMLDPQGNVINTNAKSMIEATPDAFPWKEPSIYEICAGSLTGKEGPVDAESLKGKVLGFYYSAHWCGPCRQFTPILKKNYNLLKQQGQNFEIVFCSGDRVEKEYNEYYESMPWLTLGFKSDAVEKISLKYHVDGYPTLLLFDAYGNLMTAEGRSVLSDANAVESFPWVPKPVYNLNTEPDGINNGACLILLADSDAISPEDKAKYIEVMTQAGSISLEKGEYNKLAYFYADVNGDVSAQIRGFIKLEDAPMFVIVDLPDNGGYYLPASQEISVENIRKFVTSFFQKKIERLQMTA